MNLGKFISVAVAASTAKWGPVPWLRSASSASCSTEVLPCPREPPMAWSAGATPKRGQVIPTALYSLSPVSVSFFFFPIVNMSGVLPFDLSMEGFDARRFARWYVQEALFVFTLH